jgi:DNA-binding transcriptional MerR regulator
MNDASYWTTSAAARELRCSEATVRALARAGTLPPEAHDSSGRRLYRPAAVRKLAQARTARQSPQSEPR